MKVKKIPIILIIILFSLLLFVSLWIENSSHKKIEFESGKTINIEIANTPKTREAGLMNRRELLKDAGMLFIFDREETRNFWMKNTLISLDMIFLNKDKEVVYIIKSAEPCTKEPCLVYNSKYPAKYVLEVNSGFVEENNIQIGEKLRF